MVNTNAGNQSQSSLWWSCLRGENPPFSVYLCFFHPVVKSVRERKKETALASDTSDSAHTTYFRSLFKNSKSYGLCEAWRNVSHRRRLLSLLIAQSVSVFLKVTFRRTTRTRVHLYSCGLKSSYAIGNRGRTTIAVCFHLSEGRECVISAVLNTSTLAKCYLHMLFKDMQTGRWPLFMSIFHPLSCYLLKWEFPFSRSLRVTSDDRRIGISPERPIHFECN